METPGRGPDTERLNVGALAILVSILRDLAMSIIGTVGLTISLMIYWKTGDISLPAVCFYAGLLGINSLSIGKG